MSKADDFAELVDDLLSGPDADYVVGRCQECQKEVWIDTGQRPFGMAESCEEHQPICDLEDHHR